MTLDKKIYESINLLPIVGRRITLQFRALELFGGFEIPKEVKSKKQMEDFIRDKKEEFSYNILSIYTEIKKLDDGK